MSSGNPFRASISHNPAASSPVPQTSFITADNSVPQVSEEGRSGFEGAPPPKTKKHVRIESNTTFIPPHPDDADDSPRSPPVQRLDQSDYVDASRSARPIDLSHADMYAEKTNTPTTGWGNEMTTSDGWAGTRGGYQPPPSATSPGGVPANPFSRTLASIEPQEKDNGEGRTPAGRPGLGTNRASLDVESFKNLLLTGKPGPRPGGQPMQTIPQSNVSGGPQFESSSSTDTSSISRQSLFEPPHQTHAESPRTSFEIADSDDDESMKLAPEVKKAKRKPPPAPKPRHGKPVSQRRPQTVSFDSFSASQPPPDPTTRSRHNSDVSKPLPPTPVVSAPSQQTSGQDDTVQQRHMPVPQHSSEFLATPELSRPQKKMPPPVPLARRQSQLRTSTAGNRSRSNSSLTMSSQHSVENSLPISAAQSSKDPSSIAKSPPPPPRSRHGARLSDINTSSANSSSTELPQRSGSVRTTTPGHDSRRSTLDSESPAPAIDLRRTSSIASNRPTQRVVSNESTASATMPPPPPPPRRRSNRSSLDQQRPQHIPSSPSDSRRTSMENRRTSIASESSLRREYAPVDDKAGNEYALYSPLEESEKRLGGSSAGMGGRSGSNSILDDMDKFQREIEELRLKYEKKD